jgi:hypothetical protein
MPAPLAELLAQLTPLLRALALIGGALYGGPLVCFALLMAARRQIPHLPTAAVVRTARAWGPGLGLSMGAALLGGLLLHLGARGRFAWGPSSGGDIGELVLWLSVFVVWVSNIKLEVWTLEPLRKLDPGGPLPEGPTYEAAADRWTRHLIVHAALILAVGVQLALRA